MVEFIVGFVVGAGVVFGVGGANHMHLRKAYTATKKALEDAEDYIKAKYKENRR